MRPIGNCSFEQLNGITRAPQCSYFYVKFDNHSPIMYSERSTVFRIRSV